MIACLRAHVLEENCSLCSGHQTGSFTSFAFCLNQKKGLEKVMHTSLLSAPTMVRLSQWRRVLRPSVSLIFPAPDGRGQVGEEKWKICRLPPEQPLCTWGFRSFNEWDEEFWGDEVRGWGQVKWRVWYVYVESFTIFFPKMASANLLGHHALPFTLPRCFPSFFDCCKAFQHLITKSVMLILAHLCWQRNQEDF